MLSKIESGINKLEKLKKLELERQTKIQTKIDGFNEELKELYSYKRKYEKLDNDFSEIINKQK
jgi:hypothetical protein